jgi:hypothetical protein
MNIFQKLKYHFLSKDNKILYYNHNFYTGEYKIYEQQIKAANEIYNKFTNGEKHVLLISSPQAGKTITADHTALLMMERIKNNKSFIENQKQLKVYYVLTLSSTELKTHLEKNVNKAFEFYSELGMKFPFIKILHSDDLKTKTKKYKELNEQIKEDVDNGFVVMVINDECHAGQGKGGIYNKNLLKRFNVDLRKPRENWPQNLFLLSISATPFAAALAAQSYPPIFDFVVLKTSKEYFSVEKILASGRFHPTEDKKLLDVYKDKNGNERKNLEDVLDTTFQYYESVNRKTGVAILRMGSSKNKKEIKEIIFRECNKKGINPIINSYGDHDGADGSIQEAKKLLESSSEFLEAGYGKNTVIFALIFNAFAAGSDISFTGKNKEFGRANCLLWYEPAMSDLEKVDSYIQRIMRNGGYGRENLMYPIFGSRRLMEKVKDFYTNPEKYLKYNPLNGIIEVPKGNGIINEGGKKIKYKSFAFYSLDEIKEFLKEEGIETISGVNKIPTNHSYDASKDIVNDKNRQGTSPKDRELKRSRIWDISEKTGKYVECGKVLKHKDGTEMTKEEQIKEIAARTQSWEMLRAKYGSKNYLVFIEDGFENFEQTFDEKHILSPNTKEISLQLQ